MTLKPFNNIIPSSDPEVTKAFRILLGEAFTFVKQDRRYSDSDVVNKTIEEVIGRDLNESELAIATILAELQRLAEENKWLRWKIEEMEEIKSLRSNQ